KSHSKFSPLITNNLKLFYFFYHSRTVLSLKLANVMNDAAMINTNLIGLVINFAFLFGFYYYASSESRGKIWKQVGYASVFLLVITAYANFEDPAKIEFRLGMLITAILLQNLLLLILGGIQLSMFAIYPNKPAAKETKDSKKNK
uniref:Uncharacterized protein LOC108044194 n=1 Tax=Drosophila rhopaloa TaxID=1041015 RepID=A0A6P4EPL3_DRORH